VLQEQSCTNKSAYNGEPVSETYGWKLYTPPVLSPGDTVGSLLSTHMRF
jgi:hypothetical protein